MCDVKVLRMVIYAWEMGDKVPGFVEMIATEKKGDGLFKDF